MDSGHIFLIGFMGAGKSSVARKLSRDHGLIYLEMDTQIEKDAGMTISEIFDTKGEEAFRLMETELIFSLKGKKPMVISCGGGTAMRQQNVDEMRRLGTIVYLSAEPQTIYDRVHLRHHRPLLEGNMNVEYITGLLNSRLPKYEAAADITVKTDGRELSDIADEIYRKTAGFDN